MLSRSGEDTIQRCRRGGVPARRTAPSRVLETCRGATALRLGDVMGDFESHNIVIIWKYLE